MPIAPEDLQRAALHEISHAVIAVERGFHLHGVSMEGPNDNPGLIWRTFPEGVSTETNQNWARRDLAVYAAGFLGERLFFNDNREEWITGSRTADKPMMDYCAFQHLEIEQDVATLQAMPQPPEAHLWREQLPGLNWAEYDALIAEQTALINVTLNGWKWQIEHLARILLGAGYLRGRAVYSAVGKPWNGVNRTANWLDEEDDAF